MTRQHLIDIPSLSDDLIERILERAVDFSKGAEPILQTHTIANFFFEPSTRTRVSFEIAAGRMGLRVINLDGLRSSITKGESVLDTLATLHAMGVELAVVRHGQTGACHALIDQLPRGLCLVNAGDGCGHHPTQALLDAATLIDQGVELEKAKVVIIGDLRHSRVARSNMALLQRLGVAELALAGPLDLMPERADVPDGTTVFDDLDQALTDADVVMMLRVQKERLDETEAMDLESYHRDWCLTEHRLAKAKPTCWVMHPGPMNRGIELSDEVADGARSLILEQVRMSVATRMAVFEALLS